MDLTITLQRAEGPLHDCNRPVTVRSYLEADLQLRSWAWTGPVRGYHRVDFKVVCSSPKLDYQGRFDLMHYTRGAPDLRTHVLAHLLAQANAAGRLTLFERARYQTLYNLLEKET